MTPRYIVMTRTAHMPTRVKAPYRRVALVLTDLPEGEPAIISERARGMVKIVELYERLHLGWQPKGNTAAENVTRELQAKADALNAGVAP